MLTCITIAVVTFLLYVKWRQTYWKRNGVPSTDFDFFLGHLRGLFFGQRSIGETILDRYRQAKQLGYKHAGFYYFWKPVYMPFDPMLIKHIMQQDSNNFSSHGIYHHRKDILSMHLFALDGERWRELRSKLTPAFTSGKIKMMFETLAEKTEELKKAVDKLANKEEGIAIKDICGNFTTDVIASCGFGVECDSLSDANNAFRRYGKKMLKPKIMMFLMEVMLPWSLLGNIGFKDVGRETSHFFETIVRQTIRTREQNEIYRRDFMHLLLQLKNQGTITDSTKIEATSNQEKRGLLTEEDIIAQCFVFFLAGFETSSTAMTFALLELAQNLDIQEKLRNEIDSVFARHNGEITYESIAEMTYLEKVLNETLRKFPPIPVIPRVCTRSYQIPNSNVVIEKGTSIEIPVWGIHMDPDYYPNPDLFDPERFTEDNKANRKEFTFLPFGAGPRLCIETLRKFPPAPAIPRVCTKAYKLPDSEVIIEKGTRVEIPVWGIHRDPEYYPNPDIFDPERFTEKNRANRPEFTFLPFGAGPRICIGMRFGMLQTKVGLATLIRNFKFTLNEKTPLPLEMEKGVIILTVKGNVWVDATRI